MKLKTATILAVVGASIATALGVIGLITIYIPGLAKVVYAGRGVVFHVCLTAVNVTYLLFFITLRGKQN